MRYPTAAMAARREQQAKARNIFASLDRFAIWNIHMGGTAFTTYEDEGEIFCTELKRLVKAYAEGTDGDPRSPAQPRKNPLQEGRKGPDSEEDQ